MTVNTIRTLISELKKIYLEKSKNLAETIEFQTTDEDEELIAAIKAEALSELEIVLNTNEKLKQYLNSCNKE